MERIKKDPALPAMTMDILGSVLGKADNPGELGEYITEEIRELTGARCVILSQYFASKDEKAVRVFSINPLRKKSWANSTLAWDLYNYFLKFDGIKLIHATEISEFSEDLIAQGFEISLVIPLCVGASKIGSLLILGLPDEESINSVINLLKSLSTIMALVLNNSFLFDSQEQVIQQRTMELQESNKLLQSELAERKEIEEAQEFLLQCGLPATGEDFFDSLTCYISEKLGFEYSSVGKLSENGLNIEPLSVYFEGRHVKIPPYSLIDTPCGEALNSKICFYRKEVQEKFPRDLDLVKLNAESYLGIKLADSQGIPVGIIALVGKSEFTNFKSAEMLLKIISPRVAGELERRNIEKEQQKLKDQLIQSQKMESIGRLAGGIAHDFNNMLGVILGHTEIALGELESGHPLKDKILVISKAAKRSADLTRQLLAFARKQSISPKILDLNDVVSGMLALLRRLIGEDIELKWNPGSNLWPILMDPGQIDQLLANLCVNSRDAIEDVGCVAIKTENVFLDGENFADEENFVPGDYVLLSVCDNGNGMDEGTLENIFEPFFTTKAIGKGTGLGLATVYGIVKQNKGFVSACSELGEGTTIKIYLPKFSGLEEKQKEDSNINKIPTGEETILLVEDDHDLLDMAKAMLERIGYKVITSRSPEEAIKIAREKSDEISLLITDVIMPTMNGQVLAKKIKIECPSMKSLFMSGYTADIIGRHGVMGEGVGFIQKPFSMIDFATKVRGILDQ